MEYLEGTIFAWLSFVRHGRDSSDVILAFEDAQVIQTLMDCLIFNGGGVNFAYCVELPLQDYVPNCIVRRTYGTNQQRLRDLDFMS